MWNEPEIGYYKDLTTYALNVSQIAISNHKVVSASSPTGYIFCFYTTLENAPLRYMTSMQIDTDVNTSEEIVAEICTFEEWSAMTEAEQSEYMRNHPLYDESKEGIYYSTTRTPYCAIVLSKYDDTEGDVVVYGNLSYTITLRTIGNNLIDYLKWYDEESNYADTLWVQGYTAVSTKYFRGYNTNGTMRYATISSFEHLEHMNVQFHYELPWKIQTGKNDGYPFSDDFLDRPEKSMDLPFPNGLWRITALYNDGYPYHWLIPMGQGIDMWSMAHEKEIRVYDLHEPQTGFDHNGLAVLEPVECVTKKELNGRWDLTLKHPIDDWGKWHYLVGNNVLKVSGQLFRIAQVENIMEDNDIYINVYAVHISYDLSDIFIKSADIDASDGTSYLLQLSAGRVPVAYDPELQDYNFDLYSDITGNLTAKVQMQSLMAAIIGEDDCFVNRYGGEMFRDNFYISVNSVMEKSKQNAFSIRYGSNMTAIKQTIDYSTWVTDFTVHTNYGFSWSVSYAPSLAWAAHHHKVHQVMLNYPEPVPAETVISDAMAVWKTISVPSVSYEIEIAAIKDDSLYKDFIELQQYDVGDSGVVYIEQFGINVQQKIVAIEKNELTGEITKITLGNQVNSIIRPSYYGNTISSGNSNVDKQNAALQEQVLDLAFAQAVPTPITTAEDEFLMTADGEYIIYRQE